MLTNGTLIIKVHRIETYFVEDKHHEKMHAVRFAMGKSEIQTKFRKHDAKIDEMLTLHVKDAVADAKLTLEVLQKPKKSLVATQQSLVDLQKTRLERKVIFTFGPKWESNTVQVFFTVDWKCSDKTLATIDVLRRPRFMRVSYYYDTYKTVYNYMTSFRVVAPFARFRESIANTVLTTVAGKTLFEIDEAWQFVLEKKDRVVETAVKAKKFATEKVSAASSAVYNTVAGAAEHASSTTYGVIKGVTITLLSYVPVMGPKLVV
ncbi:hypothetical protein BBJ29_003875 [Phytophthora kernoviae]|uniref:Uncharacterized protein n=1 Tax=Phytophthora kernoviae TaxID=325452 RepID=A0A3F2S1P6_9STRA|nr:hypothetical protein BBP00_00000971 [Phytophthora kernoviae]RLN70021.1 hypothetical protein BBJ29_003875 [Phytophthora kernoviae]